MATKKSTAIAKAKDNRPETGRGGKRNFPSCLPDLSSDEDRALVSQLLTEVLIEYRQPRNKGFSPETSKIIKKARGFMQTFDAKLVVSGKLNFLAYCFRAKNYYGMVDKQEMVLTPNQPQIEGLTPEQLQQKYIEASDFDAK